MWISFALLALSWLIDNWISGERGSAVEKPLKMLMTLPCLLYMAQRPPQSRWLWHGLVIGALGAVGTALYEVFQHLDAWRAGGFRANGYTNAIQFGNIALLLGLLALCGWNVGAPRRALWRAWLVAGFASGLLASLLSGSRGGWLALALVTALAMLYLLSIGHLRAIALVAVLSLGGMWVALNIPQLHLQERISQAKNEVKAFQEQGNAATSVGARLHMWSFSWHLYFEKPFFGWTQHGYMEEKRRAIDSKQLDPSFAEFNHPHNELLDAASKRGSIGLLLLIAVYSYPFLLFFRKFQASDNAHTRALCMGGMLVPVAYFGFGLTQAFLPHNSGVMVYIFLLSNFWAATLSASS